MKESMQRILESAVWAPSGDNHQPWRFAVEDSTIYLHDYPERAKCWINFNDLGNLMAHGAVIENIIIAARYEGLEPSVQLFPDASTTELTAKIVLHETDKDTTEPLYDAIRQRATNRRPYQTKPLTPDQRNELLHAAQGYGPEVVLVSDSQEIERAVRGACYAERIFLQNRSLHQDFFNRVVLSKRREAKERAGLLVHTMELPPPVRVGFYLLRHWPIMNLLNKLGMARNVSKQNTQLFSSASALLGIMIEDNLPESWVAVGRSMQRFWLTATHLGLSCQPLAGIPIIHERLNAGETEPMTPVEIDLAHEGYREIANVCKAGERQVAMLLRVGTADPPSAYCHRLPPELISG